MLWIGTAALFVTGVIAIFGLRAYLETPIEAFPDVTNAQVTVMVDGALCASSSAPGATFTSPITVIEPAALAFPWFELTVTFTG